MTSPLSSVQNELRLRRAPGVGLRPASATASLASFPQGSHTYIVPESGEYEFVGWGPGGSGGSAPATGGSGGFFRCRRSLLKGASISIVAGTAGSSNTTVTLPNGSILTATRAAADVAGSASVTGSSRGSDILRAGTAGNPAGTGAGAAPPGSSPYVAASGGAENDPGSLGPGAGRGSQGAVTLQGGPGHVLIARVG